MRRFAIYWTLLATLALAATGCHRRQYGMADPRLKIVPIDSDRHESYVGLAIDGMGRIFVGGREALFVYEPKPNGGYRARKELYRFGPDAWVFNIAVRGHDLYVLTTSALYVIPDGVVKRSDLRPQKLLWGFPTLHLHQAMHGMTFGPDGDLYISMGDPAFYQLGFGRGDHWVSWTFHHGADDAQSAYVGSGGVIRISPDGRHFAVVATGTRNDCGLAFDSRWNLFGPDNDHEPDPDEFVPGRLLYITDHAFLGWPRGWMTEKQPWRSDLLQTMSPHLGRYVPVGMCYYDDDFLPTECRNCLYVARWDSYSAPRCSLEHAGDTFQTTEFPFLIGVDATSARPVDIAVGRGGRLFGITCYMEHNDASPIYKSDLFMITRADDPDSAPFQPVDESLLTLDQLFDQLGNSSWDQRSRAHIELTRRGPEAFSRAAHDLANLDLKSVAAPHLLWLAAAATNESRARLIELTRNSDPSIRLLACRALDRFGAGQSTEEFASALDDSDAQVRHAGLLGLLDHAQDPPLEKVAAVGASTLGQIISNGWNDIGLAKNNWSFSTGQTAGQPPHWEDGSYIRQAAAGLLAARASAKQVAAWCEDADPRLRLMGVLAAGYRMSLPAFDQPPEKWIVTSSVLADGTNYWGASILAGRPEDRKWCDAARMFSTQDVWLALTMTDDQRAFVSLLERRLQDANKNIARQALFFLRMIRKSRSDASLATELGLSPSLRARQPILRARVATSTNLPPEFQKFDWSKEVTAGDVARGGSLFVTRGCNRCHSIAQGDGGAGGPSLAAAGSRLSVPYLAESIMAPNAVVLPLFRWTAFQLKDGEELNGLVVSEDADEIDVLTPLTSHITIRKEDVVSREIQDHSPMPEGLINTPDELRDLLAFLQSLR